MVSSRTSAFALVANCTSFLRASHEGTIRLGLFSRSPQVLNARAADASPNFRRKHNRHIVAYTQFFLHYAPDVRPGWVTGAFTQQLSLGREARCNRDNSTENCVARNNCGSGKRVDLTAESASTNVPKQRPGNRAKFTHLVTHSHK